MLTSHARVYFGARLNQKVKGGAFISSAAAPCPGDSLWQIDVVIECGHLVVGQAWRIGCSFVVQSGLIIDVLDVNRSYSISG